MDKAIVADKKQILRLLTCGVIAGPLFYAIAIPQMFLREGFDIRKQAISMLSLGDFGWIQVVNFMITGVLAILCAIGMRKLLRNYRGGTWGPILIGMNGVGMILAGIFKAPPSFGFPPGTPEGMPTNVDTSAMLHGAGFFIAFIALIVACFVFARRFASLKQPGWASYCIATGIVLPVLIVLGNVNQSAAGISFAVAGAVAFGWLSVIAARLRTELH